ncbi:hypothetical protein [Salana multivorans]
MSPSKVRTGRSPISPDASNPTSDPETVGSSVAVGCSLTDEEASLLEDGSSLPQAASIEDATRTEATAMTDVRRTTLLAVAPANGAW